MNKTKKKIAEAKKQIQTTKWSNRKPISAIFLKASLISFILVSFILYSDSKGYMNPDKTNDHTAKKWNSFYEFSETHEVDVLLVGNSHLYTGINPKNLSTALGCNAFILASPGTHVDDHYFALKEAIKVNKPKVLVLETYGLKKLNPKEKKDGGLSDQFKSFSARKNLWTKLTSTPNLFSIQNAPYAWSNTLRNHSFLWNNRDQIKKNIEQKNKVTQKKKKLNLGRYVRFQTGIEESTLKQYEETGAPVNGNEYETNELQTRYINDIVTLCEANDIEIVFLTLPMYEKHIANYQTWKDRLKESIGEEYSSDEFWIDMQVGEDYTGFSTHSFENTYNNNQHMTYGGSLLATYKLIDFIREKDRIELPLRRADVKWRNLFYEEEGFIENNTPKENDKDNIILSKSDVTQGIKEILVLKKEKHNTILVKLSPNSREQYEQLKIKKIRLNVQIKPTDSATQNVFVDLDYDPYHSTRLKMNFIQNINQIDILKINSAEILNR